MKSDVVRRIFPRPLRMRMQSVSLGDKAKTTRPDFIRRGEFQRGHVAE